MHSLQRLFDDGKQNSLNYPIANVLPDDLTFFSVELPSQFEFIYIL